MFRPPFAQGLSLVELLLALALGLVVTLGLTQQYVGGRAIWSPASWTKPMPRTGGRYALAFLRQSAAAAGNLGCNGRAVRLMSALNGDWDDLFEFNLPRPVQGFDYQGDGASTALDDWRPSLAPLAPASQWRHGQRLGQGYGHPPWTSGAGGLTSSCFAACSSRPLPWRRSWRPTGNRWCKNSADGRLRAGDVAVVSDCEQAAMFRITRVAAAGPGQSVLRRASGSGPYDNDGGRSLSESGQGYGGRRPRRGCAGRSRGHRNLLYRPRCAEPGNGPLAALRRFAARGVGGGHR